jgi:periplasmic protein TonB
VNIDSIPHHIERTGPQVTGWLVSCLLHGSLAVAAVFFMRHMQLAPQAEPFKWNVAMVAPSPIATPSTPEASVPPAQAKTTSALALQHPTPPTPTARPIADQPRPSVETPATPPPSPAPAVEKPTPPTQAVSPPSIAEITHKLALEQTPLSKPRPNTDQVITQTDPVASTPQDLTPAPDASAVPSPKFESSSQHTSLPLAEQAPAVHDDSAVPHNDTESRQPLPAATRPQVAALVPSDQLRPARIDYGWLSDLMAKWIEDLDKRYPAILRTEGIQGKVTLTALLHEDGMLSDVRVAKSSGNAMLDQVAVEDVRKGPPITLPRPLEQPQKPVKFSIIYDLKTAR